MRWLLSPLTPPFFGFLEMEQGWKKETMEIPIASLSAEQWLRWDLDEGDGRGREMESALEGEAKRLLSENRVIMDQIASFLIEKETITGKEFMDIFRRCKQEMEDAKQPEAGDGTETAEEKLAARGDGVETAEEKHAAGRDSAETSENI